MLAPLHRKIGMAWPKNLNITPPNFPRHPHTFMRTFVGRILGGLLLVVEYPAKSPVNQGMYAEAVEGSED